MKCFTRIGKGLYMALLDVQNRVEFFIEGNPTIKYLKLRNLRKQMAGVTLEFLTLDSKLNPKDRHSVKFSKTAINRGNIIVCSVPPEFEFTISVHGTISAINRGLPRKLTLTFPHSKTVETSVEIALNQTYNIGKIS